MKIQYALMSCNANPYYADYWPTVAAAWLKLGITPVCLFIPDNPAYRLPEAPGGIVHTIPPLDDLHMIIQTDVLRFWGSCLYPESVVIIGDIDMVPLSNHFFETQLVDYPSHAYIQLDPGPFYKFRNISNLPEKRVTHIRRVRYLWAPCHIAKGEIMHKVLELSSNFETSCKKVAPYNMQKGNVRLEDLPPDAAPVPIKSGEIYTSIRLHYSTYRPIFYISTNSGQYSGSIFDPWTSQRQQEKNSHWTLLHVFGMPYSASEKIIEHLLTTGTLPKSRINPRQLLFLTKYASEKIPIIGPWLSLLLNVLTWCILRVLAIFNPYSMFALAELHNQRSIILRKYPLISQYFRRLLRIYKLLSPK